MRNLLTRMHQAPLVESWLDKIFGDRKLSSFTDVERIQIRRNRKKCDYDLLPVEIKSKNFKIQFDMESPSLRFIILHQYADSYYQLMDYDKRELVRTALQFVEKFQFYDSYLCVPHSKADFTNVIYSTFYAYIVVAEADKFFRFFDFHTYSQTIPNWPNSNEWKNRLWIETSQLKGIGAFKDSALFYTSLLAQDMSAFLHVHHTITRAMGMRATNASSPQRFEVVAHRDTNLVGVTSLTTIEGKSQKNNLWQFLDYAKHHLEKHLSNPPVDCFVHVSLASPWVLSGTARSYATIHFPDGIPWTYIQSCSKIEANFTRSPSRRQKPSAYGPVLHGEYVVIELDGGEWVLNFDLNESKLDDEWVDVNKDGTCSVIRVDSFENDDDTAKRMPSDRLSSGNRTLSEESLAKNAVGKWKSKNHDIQSRTQCQIIVDEAVTKWRAKTTSRDNNALKPENIPLEKPKSPRNTPTASPRRLLLKQRSDEKGAVERNGGQISPTSPESSGSKKLARQHSKEKASGDEPQTPSNENRRKEHFQKSVILTEKCRNKVEGTESKNDTPRSDDQGAKKSMKNKENGDYDADAKTTLPKQGRKPNIMNSTLVVAKVVGKWKKETKEDAGTRKTRKSKHVSKDLTSFRRREKLTPILEREQNGYELPYKVQLQMAS